MELEKIKGLGPKTINLLRKLGINNSYDLITYYPFRYDIIKRSNIDLLESNDKIIIDGIVETNATVSYLKNHKDKMDFSLNIGSKILKITIFNRGFYKNKIIIGTKLTVFGKYDKKRNLVVCNDIKFSTLGDSVKIEPIYHVTSGINSFQLNNIIKTIKDDIIDYIPSYLNERYNFLSKKDSIKIIHNPIDFANLRLIKNGENHQKEVLGVLPGQLQYPSLNEVNYVAFGEATEEYHDELYSFIEFQGWKNNYISGKQTRLYKRQLKDGRVVDEQKVLTEYIRHQIHHPENQNNVRYTRDELKKSIDEMRQFIQVTLQTSGINEP